MGKIIVNETANDDKNTKKSGRVKTAAKSKAEPVQKVVLERTTAEEIGVKSAAEETEVDVDKAETAEAEVTEAVKVAVETEVAETEDAAKTEVAATSKMIEVEEKVEEPTEKKPETTEAISELEVERLSDSADVLAGESEQIEVEKVETTEKTEETAKKPSKLSMKFGKRSLSGMVMDFRAKTQATEDKVEEDFKDEVGEVEEKPRREPLSKPKSALLAIATALVVGAVGGFIIWLTGRHDPAYCTVQFEPNGGSEVEEQTVICGAMVTRPTDPTKEGFDFLGWMYNGEVFDFYSMKSVAGMILKARWEKLPNVEIVTISFNADGGTGVDPIEIKKGERIKTAPITRREGYRFLGWYLEEDGKFRKFDFSKTINSDMTLEAMWELIPQEEPKPEEPTETEEVVDSIEVANQTLNVDGLVSIPVVILPGTAKAEIAISLDESSRGVANCAESLNEDGTLTCWAVAPGEAKVVVKDLKSGKFDVFKIVVLPVAVTKVEITGAPTEAREADSTFTLGATITPANATNKTVTWSSDNPSVATVDERTGEVKIVGAGTAKITATVDGKTSTVTVTGKAAPAATVEVESVTITGAPAEAMELESTFTLGATIAPANATNKQVTWSSSNPNVATVNPTTGEVKIVGAGEATITVTAADGKTASVTVKGPEETGQE